MTRLARTADGTSPVGDGYGFVPLRAAAPGFDGVAGAPPRAASGERSDGDIARAEVEGVGAVAADAVR